MATAQYVILIENSNLEKINSHLKNKLIFDTFKNKNIVIEISDETINLEYTYAFFRDKKHLEDSFLKNYYNPESNYIGIYVYNNSNDNLRDYLICFCKDLSKEICANVYFSETNITEDLFFSCTI